uniref:Uncharacterized protein n=1 Tax=Siphoviridae sp. cteHV32 TaxID=2825588 RepID=A0A8S5QHU5_9CAUD|nr:MAG TPA: hypothetical protein [Siphoviridae sp. cteHV32]
MESYDTYFVQLRCEASTGKVGAFFMLKNKS